MSVNDHLPAASTGIAQRPWRELLIQGVVWLLGAVPLIVHGLYWLAGVLALSLGALSWSILQRQRLGGQRQRLSWGLLILSFALLLVVIPYAPDPLTGAVIYVLVSLGERLSRTSMSRGPLLLLALPTAVLLAWATVAYRPVSPLSLLAQTVGFGAVLFSGFGYGTLRQNNAKLQALTDELKAANTALHAQAARDAELSALQERERLARELHDTLGHALSTLTVQQEAARRLLARDPQRAAGQLQEAQSLTRQAMHDLRAALDDLRSAPAPSLAALVQEVATPLIDGSGPTLRLRLTDTPLSPQLLAALRPVLAEALVNVTRHAQARSVWLTATVDAGLLTLSIEDDGRGFDPVRVPEGHYGLRGMAERVLALDGALEVTARPGGGSRVAVRIPLRIRAQLVQA